MDIRNAYYIKLGDMGRWERECIKNGLLRINYLEAPAELLQAGQWEALKDAMRGVWGRDEGALTRHVNQVRLFYESNEQDIFITFHGGLLYWCRPSGPINRLNDGAHERATAAGWSNSSVGGSKLLTSKLSGNLTKVQMFRGTVSNVSEKDYLVRKLTDQALPQVTAAQEAERALAESNVELMKLLTWQDFELLVDLIFTSSGWRRVSELGKTAKTVDLEMELPSTGETAFVQVKSQTDRVQFADYVDRFADHSGHDRMFYVFHSGDVGPSSHAAITCVGPEKLAQMVVQAGLSKWLREKVG